MSIIDSYDEERISTINPEDVYPKHERTLDACIITFSYKIMDALLEDGLLERIEGADIKSISCPYPIYRYKGTNIGVIKTTVGAPITSTLMEEVGHIFSCKKFVLFGSCGGLDKAIPPKMIIVPTHAYRDEGTSYHYLPPSDFVEVKNHTAVAAVLERLGVSYVKGRTWTTDVFYRETKRNVQRRREEGCIAVEMEVSACQAVADFRGYELYNFLYRADNLDAVQWEKSALGSSGCSLDERLQQFALALEIAREVIR